MSGASCAHVGVLTVELFLGGARSLKDKRMVLRSLKDRIRSRFNASFAELDALDKWQRSDCGVCMIGNEKSHVEAELRKILSIVEGEPGVEVLSEDLQFI